jgi:hypothetical protein
MNIPPEIIMIFFLISFLVYTMPTVLVKFSRTLRGKFLLLILTIVMTIYNKTAGLLIAMLVIFLTEFNYEFNSGVVYEGFKNDTTKEYDIISNNTLLPDGERKKKLDQLAIEKALQPTDGNIDVATIEDK